MSLFRFLSSKVGTGSGSVAGAHTVANTSSHGAVTGGHGHDSHAAPWEGVNLWRTPFKGDTDTVTQVKRTKGVLDRYVENRIRRMQEMQLFALRNKATPTWVMMPKDKILLAAQGVIVVYVLYQVSTTIYNHLKAKDRLKLVKLFYKDNVN
ncbi:unnamed protein product [Rotaria socialis]|uniref:Uncharacterized protein n=1 Tax=Rotaria socialis TaxID=392032 RepID=A0A818ACH1_9BILA|nr:unnamed protein product [Rotaria socialis]CAF3402584.1 unnamed protein product [Rotaria socialis]CAF3453668.1 unnamed protein product [Rotaria socialis]CAF3514524.1 unnamed protein product [Rotaria socialis]CAF3763208.1 unnamed protein product [Rotaria socialis]